jgi:DNA adenine methylase
MSNVVQFDDVLRRTQRPYLDRAPATPFVKWAGGKRVLIPDIARHFPEQVETYWEPFVGGGAVFFTMADRVGRAVLSDLNEELVLAYKIVQDDVESLVEALRAHERQHHDDDGYFLRVRAQEPENALDIAARFIYLNKTCFNGLYRVNKKGKFNVPKGRYKNPDICSPDKLRAASAVLAKATIRLGDFEQVCQPAEGDFVYCDPPYDGCFDGYQAGGFDADEQERLRNAVRKWTDAGADVLLSNSDTALIRKLYRGGVSATGPSTRPKRPV